MKIRATAHLFFIAIAIGSLAFSVDAAANEMRGVLRNNSGVRKFGSKNGADAITDFTGALSDLPFSGEVHYNIGNTFLLRRDYDKALSEFGQAVKSSSGDSAREKETRFRSHFNSAIALTEQKKIDEALAQYQKALDLEPDSIETKTNMELLTAQGGSGEGDGEQDQQGKDGKQKDKNKPDDQQQGKKPEEPKKFENPRQQPKQFKSEELSNEDVKRILEELRRQEEHIRARMQNDQRKDLPPAKDW